MDKHSASNLDNTKAQMRKGILEFCIILMIDGEGRMYASDILKELHRIDMIVVEGTVYPLLNRLRREGVLDYTWEESQSGPPRKYYHLTPAGKTMLAHLIEHWKGLSRSISTLLKRYA